MPQAGKSKRPVAPDLACRIALAPARRDLAPVSHRESLKPLWRGVRSRDTPNRPQARDELSFSKATDIQDARRGQEAGAKERGFGQGGRGDDAVKQVMKHGKLTPGKEGLVTEQGNKLLLKAVCCATQMLRFDHLSTRPQQACFLEDGIRGDGAFEPLSSTHELCERHPVPPPRCFVLLDRAGVVSQRMKRSEAAIELLVHVCRGCIDMALGEANEASDRAGETAVLGQAGA
eukprot:5303708-Pleurochrysis_carterae.AAC.1